jgi:hypothetical protein
MLSFTTTRFLFDSPNQKLGEEVLLDQLQSFLRTQAVFRKCGGN